MTYTNYFIFNYTERLAEQIINNTELRLPARVNYAIQKNFRKLSEIYSELHTERTRIYETYCTGKTDTQYQFEDPKKIEAANKELADLMNMEQEVSLLKFNIDALGDVALSNIQMDILMLMIDGEE